MLNAGPRPTTNAVLDSSAILALLQSEPGAAAVAALLADDDCAVSSVNLAEVASKLADRAMPPETAREAIEALNLSPHAFTEEDAFAVGELRAATRVRGLSLGDRACVALASRLALRAVTMDRIWETLTLPVEVEVVQRA